MGVNELSTVLYKELELLDDLLYKLTIQELILEANRPQWVDKSSQEIEKIVEDIRTLELVRALEVSTTSEQLGLETMANLESITQIIEEPWQSILKSHLEALRNVTSQIDYISQRNKKSLQNKIGMTTQALDWLGETSLNNYSPNPEENRPQPHLINGIL